MSQFLAISKGIVEDFLQTAVFLDDKATFVEQVITTLTDPTTGDTFEVPQVVTTSDTNGLEHILDAKKIIDTFMAKGIVCSVIKCEESTFEIQKANYLKLMKKADIVVLDWDLFNDGGDKIIEIINNLTQSDEELHELRSIVIYTANSLEIVKQRLENFTFLEAGYSSNSKSYTIISLWNKIGINAIEGRKAAFHEVVDKCIEEFTETFHGIVPNVAMAAIAELRNNTHKLLGILNKNLDPAYLSHRALLGTPEEAEKHIEEIIISEIESIIHQNQIGNRSSFKKIQNAPILHEKKYQNIDFISCIKNGVESNLSLLNQKQFKQDIKKCFTEKWLNNVRAITSEKKFAQLTLFQTNYSEKNIYLTLGVIIQEWKQDKFFLCLQPRCDSTRLEGDTEFIFLELLKEKEDKFDIILPSGKKCIVAYGRKNRKTIIFTAIKDSVVPTKSLYFNSKDKKYKYVGTLKKTQAQKISNEYGSYLARVGLNESEYLRRNRSKD